MNLSELITESPTYLLIFNCITWLHFFTNTVGFVSIQSACPYDNVEGTHKRLKVQSHIMLFNFFQDSKSSNLNRNQHDQGFHVRPKDFPQVDFTSASVGHNLPHWKCSAFSINSYGSWASRLHIGLWDWQRVGESIESSQNLSQKLNFIQISREKHQMTSYSKVL